MKLWANVYVPLNGAMGSIYATRALADQMAGRDRITCIEINIPRDAADLIASYDPKEWKLQQS
ncbi:hypothetical protein ACQR1H_03105 [Bradyrhizobium sp. HKCCYLRH2015]|uniref:hypothetical protein n=1 Tax=Bradyrhizobium sp. HKCCYLRH2015 TaxID=3420742 RepID=UPI003EC0DA19